MKVTQLKEIVNLLCIRFAEEISYKIAQLYRLRLLNGDIGQQQYSFQLLPAYKFLLERNTLRAQRVAVAPFALAVTLAHLAFAVPADSPAAALIKALDDFSEAPLMASLYELTVPVNGQLFLNLDC
ncbi:hypothetical protein VE02_09959 [Pseudogymnoascus sp. 03VT05]|nr:hypothetical protein VE02_09959 [Pseudogymnoascus sp. 03VT05]